MTAIVGLEHDGKVYIGGDSASVDRDQLTINIFTEPKVFKNKNFIFGYTNSFRMGQILQHIFEPPFHKKHMSDMKYLCGSFINEAFKSFKDNGYSLGEDDDGQLFLLGYKGKLYEVQADRHICHIANSFRAVGCGSHFAFGAMESNQSIKDPKERILQALKVAEKFSSGVCGPFHVMSI